MTFILVSGKPDVGKTRVCNRLHGMIDQNGSFKLHERLPSKVACREDHITHYEKFGKHIVLNTASDGDSCMLEFAKYLDGLAQKGTHPDIIVTTIRERDDVSNKEYPMSHMLALLDAIRNNKSNLEDYYNQNIAGKSSVELSPMTMSLDRHAFVLHLEYQNVNGVPNKNIALKPYIDDSADKLRYALDFALSRL